MAKVTKQELIQKISDNITDNDELAISLMEDISDSFSESVVDSTEYDAVVSERDDYKSKYEDINAKYKERFMGKVENEPKIIEPEPEMKKYIDIREI